MHPLTSDLFSGFTLIREEMTLPNQLYRSGAYPLLYNWDSVLRVHDALKDEGSRQIFRKVVVHRVLECFLPEGRVYTLYPLIETATWEKMEKAAETLPKLDGDTTFDRVETWICKGYDHPQCHVSPGDIVFDIGAFTGNTTAYFAQQAGESDEQGKRRSCVYSLEPHPRFFALLEKNMRPYARVVCLNKGCSDHDGTARLMDNGTGSVITDGQGIPVSLCRLDSLVEELGLPRVDFIKMDIEGLEPQALSGACQTLQRFQPKLAISVYHRSEHLFSLFENLLSYDISYHYHIKHSSFNRYETILFASPSRDAQPVPPLLPHEETPMLQAMASLFLMPAERLEPLPCWRALSTWECFVQLTKNFHLYPVLRPLYRFFREREREREID